MTGTENLGFSHSLRGLCGLKLYGASGIDIFCESQPARAVWIEIHEDVLSLHVHGRHSLRGLCGLKSPSCPEGPYRRLSQPARAVWIEIAIALFNFENPCVTACEGCVD